MDIYSKLSKPITETKYLTAENCWRYRPILRYFFMQYEKIKYWMYKEEVFEELKKHDFFSAYTIEQCKQDLDVLVEWGNLLPVQDTTKASTVEEFKSKQFRYQLSEFSVEIERLTIRLENLHVEGASLEPTLFERIKDGILKMNTLENSDIKEIGSWWRDLNSDFIRLNQNYQDYIRSFYGLKAEERMKSKEFIVYKDALISYLREFVKGLQKNAYTIEEALRKITAETIEIILSKVFEDEKSIPRLDVEIIDEELIENINGRWNNLRNWFLGGSGRESEVVRVLEITNEIIRKITRYAAQIAESRNSAANRKEEYKKLCKMFLATKSMDEAHRLSAVVFGIFHTKHIKGEIIRATESVNSSVYDEEPLEVEVKPRVRNYREKAQRVGIEDKSERKKLMMEKILKDMEIEKSIMDGFIKGDELSVKELPIIKPHVRNTILKWISKANGTIDKKSKTEDGRAFALIYPEYGERCVLRCEDGEFDMPAYTIRFGIVKK